MTSRHRQEARNKRPVPTRHVPATSLEETVNDGRFCRFPGSPMTASRAPRSLLAVCPKPTTQRMQFGVAADDELLPATAPRRWWAYPSFPLARRRRQKRYPMRATVTMEAFAIVAKELVAAERCYGSVPVSSTNRSGQTRLHEICLLDHVAGGAARAQEVFCRNLGASGTTRAITLQLCAIARQPETVKDVARRRTKEPWGVNLLSSQQA